MQIRIKKLDERAKIPTRGSDYAAGYDLYALDKVDVPGGGRVFVHTGIALDIPDGYFGAIYARSGLACKHGLKPANCVGVIDSDYRGEILVCIENSNESVKIEDVPVPGVPQAQGISVTQEHAVRNHDASFTIEAGDRIAQLVIQRFQSVTFVEVDELEDTVRGTGGFGSTGTN